jgi:putative SOS response-associated peptidase YedK
MPLNINVGEAEVNPGTRGLVVREDAGERVVEAMTWGFPVRLKGMKPTSKPKPVNNIANIDSWTWRHIAPLPENRCLIPVTAFAEAEGEKGRMTRTWFTVKGHPLFSWAGLWKESDEWGAVYSGYMTDCNEAIRPVHNRMPVLLLPEDYDRWLHGSLDDVKAFEQRCFPDELIEIHRTDVPWFQPKGTVAPLPVLS